ncbi:MAG: hypothetical protein WA924_01795 [Burkholderiaceae bacterium]
MKRALCAIALMLAAGGALAQTLQQGQPAPAAVVEQIKDVPPTRIGQQAVRAVPPAALSGQQAKAVAENRRTLVVRDSDNLVGISSNELIVLGTDLDAIAASVAAMQLPGAQTRVYPKLKLAVVKTARFDQLETVRNRLAAAYPDARFDLPVTYFPRQKR